MGTRNALPLGNGTAVASCKPSMPPLNWSSFGMGLARDYGLHEAAALPDGSSLSDRFDPPSLDAAPRRSNLKKPTDSFSEPALDPRMLSDEYISDDDSPRDSPAGASHTSASMLTRSASLSRKASWRDDHGLDLTMVHHVHDTHYKRTCWKRHRARIFCLVCLLSFVVLAIYIVCDWNLPRNRMVRR